MGEITLREKKSGTKYIGKFSGGDPKKFSHGFPQKKKPGAGGKKRFWGPLETKRGMPFLQKRTLNNTRGEKFFSAL